jgi:ABC-type cobalamin/Fe3+-siderophores transport system ATPase subunit
MNGWSYDIKILPDIAIIKGPNASGKTVLLDRIAAAHKNYPLVVRINASKLRPAEGDNIASEIIRCSGGSCNTNSILLIDDTYTLGTKEMKELCKWLKNANDIKNPCRRVAKAYVTSIGNKFVVSKLILD